MANPEIKMIAVSNVFSRLMHFVNAGDIEIGHAHSYDHATLISSGAVRYEVLDGKDGEVVSSKDVYAPNFVFVKKNMYHRLIALEPNTVCACIHAIRSIEEDIISPEYFIDAIDSNPEHIKKILLNDSGQHFKNLCVRDPV